jgi:hypothetical protein
MEAMPMPQRTPEHDKLNFMAGTWKTREVHAPAPWAPQGGTGEGQATFRWTLGNLFLIQEYRSKGSMGMTFEGHGLMTFDANAKRYTSWWFDSMSAGGMQQFGHLEGKDLIFQGECDSPMGTMKMKMVTRPVSATEFTFTMDMDQGGKWVNMMKITYVKA